MWPFSMSGTCILAGCEITRQHRVEARFGDRLTGPRCFAILQGDDVAERTPSLGYGATTSAPPQSGLG